ncbi:hypothetical protein PENSPDRAFT_734072 [Peniophora sp. CONT]|nr:hypothetical protein PENSPDRAFT_734072 [Peniophora sp. CONT]
MEGGEKSKTNPWECFASSGDMLTRSRCQLSPLYHLALDAQWHSASAQHSAQLPATTAHTPFPPCEAITQMHSPVFNPILSTIYWRISLNWLLLVKTETLCVTDMRAKGTESFTQSEDHDDESLAFHDTRMVYFTSPSYSLKRALWPIERIKPPVDGDVGQEDVIRMSDWFKWGADAKDTEGEDEDMEAGKRDEQFVAPSALDADSESSDGEPASASAIAADPVFGSDGDGDEPCSACRRRGSSGFGRGQGREEAEEVKEEG